MLNHVKIMLISCLIMLNQLKSCSNHARRVCGTLIAWFWETACPLVIARSSEWALTFVSKTVFECMFGIIRGAIVRTHCWYQLCNTFWIVVWSHFRDNLKSRAYNHLGSMVQIIMEWVWTHCSQSFWNDYWIHVLIMFDIMFNSSFDHWLNRVW